MSGDHGRRFWDAHAGRYDRSMLLLGGPMPRAIERTADATRSLPKVLEVAAGTGLVTVALARAAEHVTATDYSSAMVVELERRIQAERLSNVTCAQADLYALPFPERSFDAVVAANVLHLVPDLPRALASLCAILKPGGKLIAPTYCHDQTPVSWLASRLLAITGFPGHRRFTAATLLDALTTAGLTVEDHEVIDAFIPITWVEARTPS